VFLSERLYFRLVRPPIDTRGRVDLHFPELPVQRMRTPGFMVYRLDLIQERFDCNLAQNLADILSITVRCDENMKIITREPTSVFILYFKGGWSPISPQANYNFSVTFQAQGLRRWVTCQHSKTIQYHWRGLAAYGRFLRWMGTASANYVEAVTSQKPEAKRAPTTSAHVLRKQPYWSRREKPENIIDRSECGAF
jgi:hypothetical protein